MISVAATGRRPRARRPQAPGLRAALACLALLPALAAAGDAAIEAAMDRALAAFGAPGVAVSVVRDGETVYAGGRGVLAADSGAPVDGDTPFQIGSVSKAFTAAALAVLVDEGRLGFDDRVIDHLPEFRMADPWVTREFTIRDLLTHRSGLPLGAGDLLIWPEGNASIDEIVAAFRHLQPSSSFRAKYDYDNLLYIVAGEVVARASGMPYVEFVERRLFAPLGMDDCVASLPRLPEDARPATPHVKVEGEIQATAKDLGPVTAAAGGIVCSARSMARWLRFILAEGVAPGGERLLSEATFAQLVSPVTPLPPAGYFVEHAGAFLAAYALGWNLSTFHGQPVYAHGGAVWGMVTYVMVLPRQDLAVFASANLMSGTPLAVAAQVAQDALAEAGLAGGFDWVGTLSEVAEKRAAAGAEAVAEAAAARNAESEPSLPLEAYAGTYEDPWYGRIHVERRDDGRLWFRSERNAPLEGPLEHFQYDTFIARWSDRQLLADAYVSFTLSPEGEVERIRMKAVSPTTDFSFDFHDLDLRRVE